LEISFGFECLAHPIHFGARHPLPASTLDSSSWIRPLAAPSEALARARRVRAELPAMILKRILLSSLRSAGSLEAFRLSSGAASLGPGRIWAVWAGAVSILWTWRTIPRQLSSLRRLPRCPFQATSPGHKWRRMGPSIGARPSSGAATFDVLMAWVWSGRLNPNSEVGHKEHREHKEGEGLGEHSRWTIPHAAPSVPKPSLCVLCVLCGYSISEFGLNTSADSAPGDGRTPRGSCEPNDEWHGT